MWLTACANLPYYAQAVDGHFEVLRRSQPISAIITNPDADEKLKHSLTKVIQMREFASRTLKLPDNLSYTSYADLERPVVVWNVFASPEAFSPKPRRRNMRKSSEMKDMTFMLAEFGPILPWAGSVIRF